MKEIRLRELAVLLYRVGLVYVFYQVARFLFWYFNRGLIGIDGISEYGKLAYHGIAFDTTAILYVNSLFILLSIIPILINTKRYYQKLLFWVYFLMNGVTYVMNFGDIIYYRFSKSRLTSAVISVAENENNLFKVFWISLVQNPLVPISFVVLMAFWVYLYRRVSITECRPKRLLPYFGYSVISIVLVAVLVVGGIRGDFKHSTRPINMVDANRYVTNPLYANVVLNSVFSFFRTINTNTFEEVHFVDKQYINDNIKPIKEYHHNGVEERPNIVIFIVESLGREYVGAFNQDKKIENYTSYTPFLDSLSGKSLIFTDMYANGRQSIHGMSSVLAGIPSLRDAFTSSPYSNQKIQSIVSICNDLGYDTSFYHGAPNGSMGFLGFSNILGFKHYYGKTEYNNDADFDGIWAIWDEPFLQYFAKNVGRKTPFMATVFTASSHHPFKIPEKYQGKFRKGNIPIHEPMQYTDYSLKKYFETAKKQPWYQNTIFVITGDHTNEAYYKEYKNSVNAFALPLIIYSPNPKYQLQGIRKDIAQQIDIYPTLADLIGYDKPIRSWGKSLISDKENEEVVPNSLAEEDQFIIGDYIYRFDRKDIVGIYQKTDLELKKNLLHKLHTPETERGKKLVKAWYQDYMYRIIHKKLSAN